MLRSDSFDVTLRLRLQHRPGSLAELAATIARADALIGDITTERIAERDSTRLVTIETLDQAHADRVVATIRGLDHVEVLGIVDQVHEWHRQGKLRVVPRREVKTIRDLRMVYTPGVARICKEIEAAPERAWELTGMGQTVGIFTNGTRVLGLGDIGALASLPVMEGKALLYSQLASLSAVPVLVDEKDPRAFAATVERVSAGFGAIHLEDIRAPDCYEIERLLIERLSKPVFHDDQHGTATAALAAIVRVCDRIGLHPHEAVLGQIGLGAAGSAIAKLAKSFGFKRVLVADRNESLLAEAKAWGAAPRPLDMLMRESRIVVAATGRANLISPADVQREQVILALSNPAPEISPESALAAGAAIAEDGRSVNNALAYPGIIRGALEARVRYITPEMLIGAARAIASCAHPDELLPSVLDERVHRLVCDAVKRAAGSEARR